MSEVNLDNLAELIRFHRKKSGLSQLELALMSGVGKTFIFDLEKGKKTVQLDSVVKVLSILNIKIIFDSPLMDEFRRSESEKS